MAGGFDSLGLGPELVRAIDEQGWLLPSDIQDEAIPLLLGGGDVMAAAETGSGKTGAFVLPMLQQIHEARRDGPAVLASAKAKGGGGKKGWVLNNGDKDAVVQLSQKGLRAQVSGSRWAGVRADHGVANSGRWYFEMTVESDGLCRVGWATQTASLDIGTDQNSYGFGGTGKMSTARNFQDYGEPYGNGDTIGCYIDLNSGDIWYSKNGFEYDTAFKFNTRKGALFPAVVLKDAYASFNFGATRFKFPPTNGAQSVSSAQGNQVVEGAVGCEEEIEDVGGPRRTPMGMILEPSRDLAEQVYECARQYGKYLTDPPITMSLLVGGMDKEAERTLRGNCDVVIGTIGKVVDCIERKFMDLRQIRFFILDEADRFLETDNMKDILKIYAKLPSGGAGDTRLQVAFFSATLHSPQILDLASKICFNPTWVDLKGKDSVPETVHHLVVRLNPDAKEWSGLLQGAQPPTDEVHVGRTAGEESTSERLKQMKPKALKQLIDTLRMDMCMIFCRTNLDCDLLEQYLTSLGGGRAFKGKVEKGKENQYSCVVLAGMRSQDERRHNLKAFKEGDVRFLICTDVAARGIDIQGLPYVINMTLPDAAENYIHRVGRVGRADCMGLAISLVASHGIKEKVWYHTCSSKGRGGACTRRHLKDEGGCTTWYDEPALLSDIEQRLGQPITEMPSSFQLPEGFSKGVRYGEASTMQSEGPCLHVEMIQPAIQDLARLEYTAQNNWLIMKDKFKKKSFKSLLMK